MSPIRPIRSPNASPARAASIATLPPVRLPRHKIIDERYDL